MSRAEFILLFLFGGCFQFIFPRRKRLRRAADSRSGYLQKDNSGESAQSRSTSQHKLYKRSEEHKKTTRSFLSRASHFSGPQKLSEEDKLWLQAFHNGGR